MHMILACSRFVGSTSALVERQWGVFACSWHRVRSGGGLSTRNCRSAKVQKCRSRDVRADTDVKGEESVVSCIADEFRDSTASTDVLILPKPFESINVVVNSSLTFRW